MNRPETTSLDLPPRRSMPPGVRERLRRRVVGGGAVRTPLAAAAAVAVLAAGGAIVGQSTQGDTIAVSPPTSTTSEFPTSLTLGRRAVVSVTPKATEDDVAKCELAMADVRYTIAVTGSRILVADDDLFCERTHTTVSRNNAAVGPVPVADSTASLLWRSGSGVLIGRAATPSTSVSATTGPQVGGVVPLNVQPAGDLFLVMQPALWMTLTFTTPAGRVRAEVGDTTLPSSEAWTVRREVLPPGDPRVARCLDPAMRDGAEWVGDPLVWRPGAETAAGGSGLLVMHDGAGRTAYCDVHDGRSGSANPPDSDTPQGDLLFQLRHVTGADSDSTEPVVLLGGTVDPALVRGVEVTDAQGRAVPAALKDGTFAARLDDQPPFAGRSMTEGFRVEVLLDGNVIVTIPLR